jgi:hypothetical protein
MMCIIQQSGKKTIIEVQKWQIREQNFYFQHTQKSELLPDFWTTKLGVHLGLSQQQKITSALNNQLEEMCLTNKKESIQKGTNSTYNTLPRAA